MHQFTARYIVCTKRRTSLDIKNSDKGCLFLFLLIVRIINSWLFSASAMVSVKEMGFFNVIICLVF